MVVVHEVHPGQEMEGRMPAHRRSDARSLARFGSILLASALLIGCSGAAAPSGAATKSVAPAKAAPSIDTATGIRYANATIAALTKEPFVAHVEQVTTATQEMGGQSAKVLATMSADFAGDDMGVDIEATSIGQKIDMRLRLVGKNAYVYQAGMWLKGKRSAIKAEINDLVDAVRVFKDPNDLRYMGQERVGKQDLQHFRSLRQLPYESGLGYAGHYDDFDIWVKSDGTPVRYEATFSVEDKKIGKVTGSMTMDFTKFGGQLKVKVPKTK
jgi:hypothetical protein